MSVGIEGSEQVPEFEAHGEWDVNRAVFEKSVADAVWKGLQSLIDDGTVPEALAREKHQEFLKTHFFRQLVDRQITDLLQQLDEAEQSGLMHGDEGVNV